ncbi:unnamed protein product [Durusdinium trenchii]|uniref:Uncharacterized protein n=1 Tax=Durusdinium trenchii TaxID=1381693 RepID=A0ABP0MF62_9DINO
MGKFIAEKYNTDEGDGEHAEEPDEDDDEDDSKNTSSAETILRDFNYRLRCMFMDRSRNLRVKQAMVAFEPSSVYGSRSGFQEVVLITAADPKNVFHKTSLWKQGVVCVATGDGALVVRQTLVDFWTIKHSSFSQKMNDLLQAHDNEFNPNKLKRGAEETTEAAQEEDRTTLNAGHCALHHCEADGSLWVGCSSAHTLEENTELWGFGSGDFAKGSEAADLISDTSADGRWLLFALKSGDESVILEKQRKVPDHLESASFFNKVITLNELLKSLEDSGEVNIQIAEHKLEKDSAGNFSVAPLNNVCFTLDAVKPKKKKAKAPYRRQLIRAINSVGASEAMRCDRREHLSQAR